jgi:Fe-S-cluster-containing hydrogenase component 2
MTPPPPAGATEPMFKRHWFLQTIPFLGKKFRGSHPATKGAGTAVPEGGRAVGALRGKESMGKAIKCDLCAGLPFEACVYNCPTQAIVRINPEKVLTGRDRRGLLPKH